MSEQFKLVPVNPTPEMIGAYLKAQGDAARSTDKAWGVSDPKENFKAGFAAMLAAAPTQGADGESLRPVAQSVVDHCWTMYQQGRISADHTAKEVFAEVLQSFAKWLATRDAAPK